MGFAVVGGADTRGAVQSSLANGGFKARTAMMFARLKWDFARRHAMVKSTSLLQLPALPLTLKARTQMR